MLYTEAYATLRLIKMLGVTSTMVYIMSSHSGFEGSGFLGMGNSS